MSAFMVEDKTINRIVSFLYHDREHDWTKRRLKSELGIATNPLDEPTLGAMMFTLNEQGVNARYGENQAEEFRPLDYRYNYELSTKMQALKSLQCWLYQCAEGDVPEMPLYKIMDEYANSLAKSIVHDLPAYNAAEWA